MSIKFLQKEEADGPVAVGQFDHPNTAVVQPPRGGEVFYSVQMSLAAISLQIARSLISHASYDLQAAALPKADGVAISAA